MDSKHCSPIRLRYLPQIQRLQFPEASFCAHPPFSALGGYGAIDEMFHRTEPWSTEPTTSDTWKPDDKRTWNRNALANLSSKDTVEWFQSTLFENMPVLSIEVGQTEIRGARAGSACDDRTGGDFCSRSKGCNFRSHFRTCLFATCRQ